MEDLSEWEVDLGIDEERGEFVISVTRDDQHIKVYGKSPDEVTKLANRIADALNYYDQE